MFIRFKNVNFSYNENQDLIFKDLSFQILNGDVANLDLLVVKKYSVDLICGLIQNNSGEIKINGINIQELKNHGNLFWVMFPSHPFSLMIK